MKKLLLFVLAVMGFAACTNDPVEEQVAVRHDAPETLTVGFEGDDTRIQLNEAQKTVWTNGDQVSVFYLSDANQKWQYDGETGSRTAELKRVNAGTATTSTTGVVIVYPYNTNYYINTRTLNVKASLPAVQHYLANSYGLDGNIMISQSEYNQGSLKNVCGWLKLQLTGNGEVVKSITFKGKDGEQVAGELYINSADATAILASDMGDIAEDDGENATGGTGANLVFDDTIFTEVTLDCGEGVTLGAEPTAFYIAIPPQTFEKGFKVEIVCADDTKMVKSSNKAMSIERNHIQPMTAMEFTPPVPNNQIWYTSSDGNIVTPYETNVFGAKIISNTYNNGKGVITFNGAVTTIGNEAFNNCTSLTSVNIPDSVTSIGESAFLGCYSLTSVNIPDSVTTIGNYAFLACFSLTKFKGKFATEDGRSLIVDNTIIAYANASGTTYTIPDSVTTIGLQAFSYCYSLTSVTIGDSVTTIGDGAFHECPSLTSVTIGDSVTTIGEYAFSACASLTSVTIPDSVTTIGGSAFASCDSLTSVTIGDSVTTIGEYAFYSCDRLTEFKGKFASEDGRCLIVDGVLNTFAPDGLTEYTIPDSVTTIGNNAFRNCESLTSVTIPDSVTTIGEAAFNGCTSLTSVTIGDSVTTIGQYAFASCDSLTSVTIGDSVTTIGNYAFSGCDSLTEFTGKFAEDNGRILVVDGVLIAFAPAGISEYTIPDSVTSIGEGAFNSCYSLTCVTIGDSVTKIGDYAFFDCGSLTSVTIGDSVTTIRDFAFYGCASLTSVYCKATTPPTLKSGYVFYYNGSGRKIYVPAGSVNVYKSAEIWSYYASDIVGYDFE